MRVGHWLLRYEPRRDVMCPLVGISWVGKPWQPTIWIGVGFARLMAQKVGKS